MTLDMGHCLLLPMHVEVRLKLHDRHDALALHADDRFPPVAALPVARDRAMGVTRWKNRLRTAAAGQMWVVEVRHGPSSDASPRAVRYQAAIAAREGLRIQLYA